MSVSAPVSSPATEEVQVFGCTLRGPFDTIEVFIYLSDHCPISPSLGSETAFGCRPCRPMSISYGFVCHCHGAGCKALHFPGLQLRPPAESSKIVAKANYR